MLNDRYITPAGGEIDAALSFLSHGLAGAEAYTFLRLNREKLPTGCFWCAFENGRVKSVIYNNGDRTVETAAGAEPYPGLLTLRFTGAFPAPDPRVSPLALADAQRIYTVISGKKMTPDEEARYVYRARAMRDGLAKGFGVKENGRPVSFAFIVAQNEDSALIGDVFTVPAFRGRGYGGACVLACAAAAGPEKNAYVLCEEKNRDFYQKLGFC